MLMHIHPHDGQVQAQEQDSIGESIGDRTSHSLDDILV